MMRAMALRPSPLLTTPSRRWAPVVALLLAVAVGAPVRAAAPGLDYERLIAEADGHASEGRHAQALRAYSEAFRSMPLELKVSGVGEFVAVAAGKAAIDDYQARAEVESLEQGRMILLAFIGATQSADPALEPPPLDGAKERLAEIDALMPKTADAPSGPPPAAPGEDRSEDPAPEDVAPDRSGLGLGLAVAGGVATLAGLGLVIAGVRQVPWYEAKLASEGWMTTDDGYDQQIADAERIRNVDLGLGAGILVVGLGVGITGAVLLAKSKQRKRELAVMPGFGRDRAMLGVSFRF
jgi:hypothetical protein